jgi:hypothetical protein
MPNAAQSAASDSPGVKRGGTVHNSGAHVHPAMAQMPFSGFLSLTTDHYCGTDFSSEAAKTALAQYARDKKAGLYPVAAKGGYTPIIGDERSFNVSENSVWMPLEFRLVDITDVYYLWVEIAEVNNGHVSATDIANLRKVALESSPARSIDPSKGFIANDNDVYGLPPNVDGDGIVDLLMYDIGRGSGNTLGYVAPQDLIIGGPANEGNQRDILYLDSFEGTSSLNTLAAIAAHEYTHLIHQGYGSDETFLSEGYAEFAIDFNGYFWRPTTYTSSISEVTLSLFNWRRDANGNQNVLDYERAALFVTYLGQRAGTAAVGEMLRGINKKGAAGIDSVLTTYGMRLSDVIRDFHTANFFNDRSLDPRFGFVQPERAAHNVSLTTAPVNGEIMSTEGEGGYFHSFVDRVNSGAVRYLRFNSVADISYRYDVPIDPIFGAATQTAARVRNTGRVAAKRVNSPSIEFTDISSSDLPSQLSGRFEWVMFTFVHNDPGINTSDRITWEANWTPLSKATDVDQDEALPARWALEPIYPNPFNPQTSVPIVLDAPQRITLEVYDMLGRLQAVLADGVTTQGRHTFQVDAAAWPSGNYVVRLSTESGIQTRMMTLLR